MIKFKRLHKNGFVIFDMSLETKSLIKEYGTSNIYKVLQDKKLWSRVVKGQENNSDVKDAEFSNIRWSKFFIDISSLKEEFGDGHPILQIILSLQSDLKRLFDIKNNENYSEAITILYSVRSSFDVQGYHVDFDPDIIENGLIFFNDILTEKFSTTKIGLNNLKFKLIKQETFDKQTEWLKIIL